METRTIQPQELDLRDYIRRTAEPEDCPIAIETPTQVRDPHGNLLCTYDRFDPEPWLNDLATKVQEIKFGASTRQGGLSSTSRTFGALPKLVTRGRDYCRQSSIQQEHPGSEKALLGAGERMSQRYLHHAPETFTRHSHEADSLNEQWRLPGSPFTSGIVNENNPLKYHYDTGNIDDVYSAMLVLRKDVEGGWLCIPPLGARFLLENGAVFLFDGQSLLHGVSPMKVGPQGYRYSIVYYSMKQVWACKTVDEELAGARSREIAR